MASAKRHPTTESLRTLLVKLFWPEWLSDPRTSTKPSPGAALPTRADSPPKLLRALPVSTTDGLPPSLTRNGHASLTGRQVLPGLRQVTGTAPQLRAVREQRFTTVLGTDDQTGEACSVRESSIRIWTI